MPKDKDKKKIFHSGVGRFDWITMRTMSLWKSGDSTGDVSLEALFDGERPDGESHIDIERLAFLTCRGGWPGSLELSEKAALHVVRAYLKAVVILQFQIFVKSKYDIPKTEDHPRPYEKMPELPYGEYAQAATLDI